MITLGLDPSITGFGWCIHDSEAEGPARVVAKGVWKTSPKTIFVVRYMELRESLCQLLDQHLEVQAVGVESPPMGEQWSEGLYGLFIVVNEAVYTHRKDVVYFDPLTIKMLVKGDPKLHPGKMFKTDMVQAARADTEIKGHFNHNEADAYHLARFTARFWSLFSGVLDTDDLTPSELQAFSKVHTFVRGKRAGETVFKGAIFKENKRFFRFSLIPKD